MSNPARRVTRWVVVAVLAIPVVFIVLANPLGDALKAATGWPNLGVGAVLMLLLALTFVPLVLVSRRGELTRAAAEQDASLGVREWAARAGWEHTAAGGDEVPSVIQRNRAISSARRERFVRESDGLRSTMTVWAQDYNNRMSPITARVNQLVLVTEGVPAGVSFRMGSLDGVGRFFVSLHSSPARWAGIQPNGFALAEAQHPWGPQRVAVWPGERTPPPAALAPTASRIDTLQAWLAVADGRLEIAVRLGDQPIDPAWLLDIQSQVIAAIDGSSRI